MGELSDRFGDLMARMAKGDAELFRVVGEQNSAIRQLVEEVVPASPDRELEAAALKAGTQPSKRSGASSPSREKTKARMGAATAPNMPLPVRA